MQDPINRHLGTIPQLCRAISSQLRHVSTIGKKLVKQQYLLYMSPQYGEVRPTSGCDRFVSLGHPGNFNGFRVSAALLHGTLVVGIIQTAALNRGRHLYSAGWPSRWHWPTFLVLLFFVCRKIYPLIQIKLVHVNSSLQCPVTGHCNGELIWHSQCLILPSLVSYSQ